MSDNMQKIKKEIVVFLLLAVLSSILFVAGIPMICIGASKGITAVLIMGIVFTGVDFYAMPVLWIAYGGKTAQKRLVFAITEEHITSVADLAVHLSSKKEDIAQSIKICVTKGYLVGYFFDGKNILPNRHRAPDEQFVTAECRFCGAKFTYRAGEEAKCPYCESYVQDGSDPDGE